MHHPGDSVASLGPRGNEWRKHSVGVQSLDIRDANRWVINDKRIVTVNLAFPLVHLGHVVPSPSSKKASVHEPEVTRPPTISSGRVIIVLFIRPDFADEVLDVLRKIGFSQKKRGVLTIVSNVIPIYDDRIALSDLCDPAAYFYDCHLTHISLLLSGVLVFYLAVE